jgi:hypothetical protein
MHLDDERIQRLLHDEMDSVAKDAATRHAAECELCARAIEYASRDEALAFGALGEADHAAPDVSVEMIAARARGLALEERSARRDAPPRGNHARGWFRRAAAVLIVIAAAGAAYALPGSPLPALLDRIIATMTGFDRSHRPSETVAPAPSAPPSDQPVTSGIAFAPRERFTIRFASSQERGSVTVTLTDDTNISVRVVGETTPFDTDVASVTIVNTSSTADYEIDVPKSAPWVAIEIAGERVFSKQGPAVTTSGATDADGRRVLRLSR